MRLACAQLTPWRFRFGGIGVALNLASSKQGMRREACASGRGRISARKRRKVEEEDEAQDKVVATQLQALAASKQLIFEATGHRTRCEWPEDR